MLRFKPHTYEHLRLKSEKAKEIALNFKSSIEVITVKHGTRYNTQFFYIPSIWNSYYKNCSKFVSQS